jgi:hypothetical protein
MNEKLFRTVQAALLARWDGKLAEILVCAKNFSIAGLGKFRSTPEADREAEVERLVREAYMAGYRQAYWDGIVDFVEASSEVKNPVRNQYGMSSVVH